MDAWDSVRLRTASTQWNIAGKYGPHGELLFFLIQKAFVSDSEAFNSFIGDGFRVELNGGSEASDGDQADNVSNKALYVIGLHGSGDKNFSLHAGLGDGKGGTKLSRQEMYELERRRGWFGF